MGLLQVVVYTAASRLESPSLPEQVLDDSQNLPSKASDEVERDVALVETETNKQNKVENGEPSISDRSTGHNIHDVFTQLPKSDLRYLSRLLGYEGYELCAFLFRRCFMLFLPRYYQYKC